MNQNDATLSPQLKDTFQRCLVKYGLPEHEHSHYHRWLKMYFVFCQKYEFHPPASRSKLSFIREIESQKRYAQKYIHQADYAIQIYHKIFKVVQSKRQHQNQELGWEQSLNKLTEAIQLRHYSKQTLRSYVYWVKRYMQFHNSKQPLECAGLEITKFLSFLAIKEQVAPATQNQAFNALLFFYRHALEMPNVEIKGVIRAKEKVRVPEIMTLEEVHTVISHLPQKYQLIGKLLYGSGMRLSECLNLRVQDFDFDEMKIRVIRGKGRKSRTVPLPRVLEKELRAHLEALQKAFETRPQRVFLPKLLEKKYPNAGLQWRWQWVFPAFQNTYIKDQDIEKRSHLHPTHIQRAMVKAVDKSGIAKKVSAHTFRHSFASHLLQSGVDIRTIQELLGHSDLKTTMVYTHTVKEPTSLGAMSPLDLQRV